MIPYARQSVAQSDIDAVVEVLESDFLTQGEIVPAFERAICDYSGAGHAVAVNSGTSALHIACLSLGLGDGDFLWTTPVTFVASANCALFCRAQVDFVDIDQNSWNMDVALLEKKLELAKACGKLPRILVVVHMAGMPADMQQIHALSKRYGFRIIEDASHALGAVYHGKPVGCCQYSDITIFSFHPAKSITSGEGGMSVTNDEQLAQQMRLYAGHGITRNPDLMDREPEGDWYYQQVLLGHNYRLSDIHAALGLSQLQRLNEFINKRKEIAESYNRMLHEFPVQLQQQSVDSRSAWHLYIVLVNDDAAVLRRQLFDKLRENGIGVNVHYIPVHLQPYYRKMGFVQGDYPVAENYYSRAMTLPCYPLLKESEQQHVIDVLSDLLK